MVARAARLCEGSCECRLSLCDHLVSEKLGRGGHGIACVGDRSCDQRLLNRHRGCGFLHRDSFACRPRRPRLDARHRPLDQANGIHRGGPESVAMTPGSARSGRRLRSIRAHRASRCQSLHRYLFGSVRLVYDSSWELRVTAPRVVQSMTQAEEAVPGKATLPCRR